MRYAGRHLTLHDCSLKRVSIFEQSFQYLNNRIQNRYSNNAVRPFSIRTISEFVNMYRLHCKDRSRTIHDCMIVSKMEHLAMAIDSGNPVEGYHAFAKFWVCICQKLARYIGPTLPEVTFAPLRTRSSSVLLLLFLLTTKPSDW